MVDWDEDSTALARNLARVRTLLSESAARRDAPSGDLALEWHRTTMRGLDVPDPRAVGTFRGPHPLLEIDVAVGPCLGTRWVRVPDEIAGFMDRLARALASLDAAIPPGTSPSSNDQLAAVLTLCALAHARWVSIHPFRNGNGRTARFWVNWVALRYGVPAFMVLRPRPVGDGYEAAARAALCDGNLAASIPVFIRMHDRYLNEHGGESG